MGYFPVRYDSRVIIYDCKMFIRLAKGVPPNNKESLDLTPEKISKKLGLVSGCDLIGRSVPLDFRCPQFESSHR